MTTRQSTRCLIVGQAGLLICLGFCFWLKPQFLRTEGGVSNYGVHKGVIILYTLGFLLSGVLTFLAGRLLPRSSHFLRLTATGLKTLGVLFIAALLSTYPYKLNDGFKTLHVGIATLLLAYELAFILWLFGRLPKDKLSTLLLGVEATGGLLAILSLSGAVHLLLISQLLAAISFAGLLIRIVSRLPQTAKSLA